MATLTQPRLERKKRSAALGVRLDSFRLVRPPYECRQEDALDWLAQAHIQAENTRRTAAGLPPVDPGFANVIPKLLRRYGCSPHKIATRASELGDFLHQDWQRMEVFRVADNARGAGMAARMTAFQRGAARAMESLFVDEPSAPPQDLLHVTCTGYDSPSAAQLLVLKKG